MDVLETVSTGRGGSAAMSVPALAFLASANVQKELIRWEASIKTGLIEEEGGGGGSVAMNVPARAVRASANVHTTMVDWEASIKTGLMEEEEEAGSTLTPVPPVRGTEDYALILRLSQMPTCALPFYCQKYETKLLVNEKNYPKIKAQVDALETSMNTNLEKRKEMVKQLAAITAEIEIQQGQLSEKQNMVINRMNGLNNTRKEATFAH